MVSNLNAVLLYCISSVKWQCFPQFAVSKVAASVGCLFYFLSLPPSELFQFVTFKICIYYRGDTFCWVKSGYMELSWLQAILFHARGGKGVWRSIRVSQARRLYRSAPRALAEDWWSLRAQSCLPDHSASFSSGSSTFLMCF